MPERAEPVAVGLRRAWDYEQHLGGGRVLVFEGHPRYCPETRWHDPHRHEYRYLDSTGAEWAGDYWCVGEPMTFADRPSEMRDDTSSTADGSPYGRLGPGSDVHHTDGR